MTVRDNDDIRMSDTGWLASDSALTNDDGDAVRNIDPEKIQINAEYADEEGRVVDFTAQDGTRWYVDGNSVIYDLRDNNE